MRKGKSGTKRKQEWQKARREIDQGNSSAVEAAGSAHAGRWLSAKERGDPRRSPPLIKKRRPRDRPATPAHPLTSQGAPPTVGVLPAEAEKEKHDDKETQHETPQGDEGKPRKAPQTEAEPTLNVTPTIGGVVGVLVLGSCVADTNRDLGRR